MNLETAIASRKERKGRNAEGLFLLKSASGNFHRAGEVAVASKVFPFAPAASVA
jgi:hypothetical protein